MTKSADPITQSLVIKPELERVVHTLTHQPEDRYFPRLMPAQAAPVALAARVHRQNHSAAGAATPVALAASFFALASTFLSFFPLPFVSLEYGKHPASERASRWEPASLQYSAQATRP